MINILANTLICPLFEGHLNVYVFPISNIWFLETNDKVMENQDAENSEINRISRITWSKFNKCFIVEYGEGQYILKLDYSKKQNIFFKNNYQKYDESYFDNWTNYFNKDQLKWISENLYYGELSTEENIKKAKLEISQGFASIDGREEGIFAINTKLKLIIARADIDLVKILDVKRKKSLKKIYAQGNLYFLFDVWGGAFDKKNKYYLIYPLKGEFQTATFDLKNNSLLSYQKHLIPFLYERAEHRMGFSPSGSFVYLIMRDRSDESYKINVANTKTGKSIFKSQNFGNISNISWSNDEKIFITHSSDTGRTIFYSGINGPIISSINQDVRYKELIRENITYKNRLLVANELVDSNIYSLLKLPEAFDINDSWGIVCETLMCHAFPSNKPYVQAIELLNMNNLVNYYNKNEQLLSTKNKLFIFQIDYYNKNKNVSSIINNEIRSRLKEFKIDEFKYFLADFNDPSHSINLIKEYNNYENENQEKNDDDTKLSEIAEIDSWYEANNIAKKLLLYEKENVLAQKVIDASQKVINAYNKFSKSSLKLLKEQTPQPSQ